MSQEYARTTSAPIGDKRTPSIDAIRRALEPIEKAAAKERISEGGRLGKLSLTSRSRDKIGARACSGNFPQRGSSGRPCRPCRPFASAFSAGSNAPCSMIVHFARIECEGVA